MTLVAEPEAPPRVKRWTKGQFYDAVDRGAFDGDPVFLFRGELIEVPPMRSPHATGITRITTWLVRTFDPEFVVRIQLPFETPGETVPMPDGAVVTPERNERLPHPGAAALVIEVADSSVALDRQKAFDYASALVPDYWLLDLRGRELGVYRDPVPDPATATGFRYTPHRVYRDCDSVAPLARPDAAVAVATLVAAPR